MIEPTTGDKWQLEPPLAICYTLNPFERSGKVNVINDMLYKMEREFLARMDGNENDR
jgi:hypothetical protein